MAMRPHIGPRLHRVEHPLQRILVAIMENQDLPAARIAPGVLDLLLHQIGRDRENGLMTGERGCPALVAHRASSRHEF